MTDFVTENTETGVSSRRADSLSVPSDWTSVCSVTEEFGAFACFVVNT